MILHVHLLQYGRRCCNIHNYAHCGNVPYRHAVERKFEMKCNLEDYKEMINNLGNWNSEQKRDQKRKVLALVSRLYQLSYRCRKPIHTFTLCLQLPGWCSRTRECASYVAIIISFVPKMYTESWIYLSPLDSAEPLGNFKIVLGARPYDRPLTSGFSVIHGRIMSMLVTAWLMGAFLRIDEYSVLWGNCSYHEPPSCMRACGY